MNCNQYQIEHFEKIDDDRRVHCAIPRGGTSPPTMKQLRVLILAAALAGTTALSAFASSLPEFRGVLSLGNDQRLSLSSPGGTESAWVAVGESFAGYEVSAYKADEQIVVLRKDGAEFKVRMSGSQVGAGDAPSATKATLEDANEVIRKMNFDAMLAKVVDQQKKAAINMSKQMAARMGVDQADAEDFSAHQEKVMNTLFKAMDIEGMKGDIARIYSEVFTKEELGGYSEFLSTPAGKAMVDRQPDVQQKMMEVMQPRMMAALPEIQKLSVEFGQRMKAKKDAQKAAAAAAAPQPNP